MSELNNPEVQADEVAAEETTTMKADDYKVIVDMVKEMDEQYETLKSTLEMDLSMNHGLKTEILDMVLPYEKDSISTMNVNDIRTFLGKYAVDNRYDLMSDEMLVSTMTTVKDESLLLLSTKAEADDIRNESNDVLKEYFNYLSSEKVVKSREQQLDAMKAAMELEIDEHAKAAIKKKIDVLESALHFTFLLDRFDKYGDKEVDAVKEAFFDGKKGKYIIDRYKTKIQQMGFNVQLYHYFFNIEENFLDKKYSPLNNVFLFTYMRMVAYTDINNKEEKMLVQSLTGAMANLIYHRFESTENEKYFLNMITQVLDKFDKYVEYFRENNTTYEEHPARKAAEAAHEINRKEALISKMNEMNITGYDESLSADELQKFFNDETDKIIAEQLEEERKKHEIEDDEDEEDEVVSEESTVESDDMIVPIIRKEEE